MNRRLAALRRRGQCRWPALLHRDACRLALEAAERIHRAPADLPGYVPTAASVPIPRQTEDDRLAPLAALCDAVEDRVAPLVRALLGPLAAPLPGQRWLRRQHPPQTRPAGQAPHGWHQDGALGFDFLQGPPPAKQPPRALLTVWIPLLTCGRRAPGLALRPGRWTHLWSPLELARLAPRAPTPWCPRLAAGEALLFTGDRLHRTAADPGMDRVRTSLELRFERSAPQVFARGPAI